MSHHDSNNEQILEVTIEMPEENQNPVEVVRILNLLMFINVFIFINIYFRVINYDRIILPDFCQ